MIPGTFGKHQNFPKNVDFARVTFQFFARVHAARKLFSDMTTDLGSSSQDPPETRAVLAGVKKIYLFFQGLNVLLAVGPSLLHMWAPGGECFAPLLGSSESVILKHFGMFLCSPDVSETIPDHSGHFWEKSNLPQKCRFRACHFSVFCPGPKHLSADSRFDHSLREIF